jgi:hypothetical protein
VKREAGSENDFGVIRSFVFGAALQAAVRGGNPREFDFDSFI